MAGDSAMDGSQEATSSIPGNVGAARDHRRLTRAAFSKTLRQHTERKSVFNIRGLHRLQETFHALDRSIGSGANPYYNEGITDTAVSIPVVVSVVFSFDAKAFVLPMLFFVEWSVCQHLPPYVAKSWGRLRGETSTRST